MTANTKTTRSNTMTIQQAVRAGLDKRKRLKQKHTRAAKKLFLLTLNNDRDSRQAKSMNLPRNAQKALLFD